MTVLTIAPATPGNMHRFLARLCPYVPGRFLAALSLLSLIAASSAMAASLTIVSPTAGAKVASRTISFRAVTEGFTPGSVEFYRAEGTPDDSWVDAYLGSASRAPDGSYNITSSLFTDGGPQLVYAQAMLNNSAVRGTVTFTVDRRTGTTGLNFTSPANNATVSTRAVTIRAVPVNFVPDRVDFYHAYGTPDDNLVDRYLGQADRAPDGSFSVTGDFTDGGPYLVYGQYHDGFNTVRGFVNFRVNSNSTLTLTLSAPSVVACGTVEATIGLSPAPTTDAVVTLLANKPLVSMPGTAVVLAGTTSAKVTVTGLPVRSATAVTLTAQYAAEMATANLTVNPYPRPAYAFTVESVGNLGGSYSIATGINGNGQVVGYAPKASGLVHAFRTGPNGPSGPLVDLDPASPDEIVALDVNDAGQVTGYIESSDGKRTAFRADPDGMMYRLATPSQIDAQGRAINNNGQITGWFKASNGNYHAFRTSPGGTVSDLSVFTGGTYSYGYGINVVGRVAGFGDDSNGLDYGFLTAGAGNVASSVPLGDFVYPYDVNNNGIATGEIWNYGDETFHLFRSRADGFPVDLGRLGSFEVYGSRINAHGAIAGTAYSYNATTKEYIDEAAVYYSDALGLEDLNTLIDPASGWTLVAATDINDAGQIVGYGWHDNAWRAYRLTPIVPDVRYGDADADGFVEMADVIALMRMAAGVAPLGNPIVIDIAPAPACNPRGFGDGVVTVADSVRLARYLAGLETVWP